LIENKNIRFIALVAADVNNCIGNQGAIPWHIPDDLKRFAKITRGGIVVMGRKTYESLPEKSKPLPHRLNIILTKNPDYSEVVKSFENIAVVTTLEEMFLYVQNLDDKYLQTQDSLNGELKRVVWIIGGGEIYSITKELWDDIYLTRVQGSYKGDAFFPEIDGNFKLYQCEVHSNCQYEYYMRIK
jgi:dihydrofolate reductase